MQHIFQNRLHGHGLQKLVKQIGSPEKVFLQIQRSVDKLPLGKGKFEALITVGNETITVRGFVQNGVAKIATAFR